MTVKDPFARHERFVYVATFKRHEPLTFRNSDMAMARDHANYVAWHEYNDTVTKVRRATPEEIAAFEAEWAAKARET